LLLGLRVLDLFLLLQLLDVGLPLLCTLNGLIDLGMIIVVEHLPKVHTVGLFAVGLHVDQEVAKEQDLVNRVQLRLIQVVAIHVIVAVVLIIILIVLIIADKVDISIFLILDDLCRLAILVLFGLLVLLVLLLNLLPHDYGLPGEVDEGLHDHLHVVGNRRGHRPHLRCRVVD